MTVLLANPSEIAPPRVMDVAIFKGRIAGAGLDVFEREPPPDSPLLHMDQVVLSPHIAGGTFEAARRTIQASYANIVRVHNGQAPLNVA